MVMSKEVQDREQFLKDHMELAKLLGALVEDGNAYFRRAMELDKAPSHTFREAAKCINTLDALYHAELIIYNLARGKPLPEKFTTWSERNDDLLRWLCGREEGH